MSEDEEILNNQVHAVSVKSGLRSDVVLYLLRQGWTYIQTMGKPDQWVKQSLLKFTISKEELTTHHPDMVSVIRQELLDITKGKK